MTTAVFSGSEDAGRGVEPPPDAEVPASFWTSLRFFNAYRLIVASLFIAAALVHPAVLDLAGRGLDRFRAIAWTYLALAIVYQLALRRSPHAFPVQLTLHVLTDIVAITLLMDASGGFKSGVGVMLLISLAGAALVASAALTLLYAAVASIAVLLVQGLQVVADDAAVATLLQPGLLSIGFFATATLTNRLAQRVIMNERVARQRAVDLANQLRVSDLVIQDVQDGVLVVDGNGLVRQANRRVEALTGRPGPDLDQLEHYWPDLARELERWRREGPKAVQPVRSPEGGKPVRARFADAGVAGAGLTLVFLEDLSELEEQSRQLKLAALGRLTANIAHEIRNPLSAITHAGDLLAEENRAAPRERLIRIIRDNAQRLDRMVADVLEINRRDRLAPEPIRLSAFLGAFADDFAQSEEIPRAGLLIACEGDPVVQFDRVHLHQVVWNLARNAWRHSRQQTGSVAMQVRRAGQRLELHVMDDGPGVAAEVQPQLFEPFFTTFSSGTGLGLYIARELCVANGATLDYLARGPGADFRIQWQGAAT
jgi:two-component system sensor histidine kinase PilS (NtrC family)